MGHGVHAKVNNQNQPINQSINQSINQWIQHSMNSKENSKNFPSQKLPENFVSVPTINQHP